METLLARDIMRLTEDELWSLDDRYEPRQEFRLEFDDVIITTNIRSTIVSWYYWWFHRNYPTLPLLADHHISSIGHFHGGASPAMLTKVAKTLLATLGDQCDYDVVAKQIYEVENDIYNMYATRLGAYSSTMDALEYTDVLYHPEIKAAREKCIEEGGSPKTLNELYDTIPRIFAREDFLPGNALVEAARTKNASVKQILHCIGMIGYRTDIDSRIFQHPVMECFGTGLKKFNDFLIETRSASKALMFQKDPIRDTEYFNRRLQLLNQTVRYLIKGDCGTTETLPWTLQPGDLTHMDGKYYYDDNNQLQVLSPKDKTSLSLIGKTIRLRSPCYCKHTDIYGVCHTCLGLIAKTVPQGTNIGHAAAYTMCEKITQAVLSVKHLDGITDIKGIDLDRSDKRYVRLSEQKNELIIMQKHWRTTDTLMMLLPVNEVENLTQAMQTDSLTSLNIYKVSQLYKIGFKHTTDDEEVVDWVTVSGPSRPSSLTIPFLEHIKRVKYVQEDAKYLEVPMDGWDFNLPILQLPQKQINMLDFMKQFSNMLECGPKDNVKRGLDPTRPQDIATYIRALLEFSSQHIDIPLYCLEITTLALMVRSADQHDYRIVGGLGEREFATSASIMRNRSAGAALAYEEQANMITSAMSFNRFNRAPAPIDALFIANYDDRIFDGWYDDQPIRP